MLTATYSGDGNFRPSTSATLLLPVNGTESDDADFMMAVNGGTTQTIAAGSSASFSFTVQQKAGLASQITLAASGLPDLATANFNPAYVPPGSPATTVTMTIATPKTAAAGTYQRIGDSCRIDARYRGNAATQIASFSSNRAPAVCGRMRRPRLYRRCVVAFLKELQHFGYWYGYGEQWSANPAQRYRHVGSPAVS